MPELRHNVSTALDARSCWELNYDEGVNSHEDWVLGGQLGLTEGLCSQSGKRTERFTA